MIGLGFGNEKAVIEDAKRNLNKVSQSISRIEGYKSEFRNLISSGLYIKDNVSLQSGINNINNSIKNSHSSIKSGLDNLAREVEQKNKK
ncbi:hypothetical protein [Clostridium sp. HBUAS56017]|uniref:hypothetical protein n=1 Tax=Clostridium sp. HBUAS56017 TaxID=2571128 RepID=UPI00117748A4|nr:hypothetical protein [Clostridium sp. HBUAS56017]